MMDKIPEEAVKAAVKGYNKSNGIVFREQMRDAITAALPFLPLQGAVKKLEWENSAAQTQFGEYTIVFDEDEEMHETPYCAFSPNDNIGHYENEEAAKAAAQADFEARILSELEPSAARELALEEGYRQGIEAAAQKAAEMLVFADTTSTADREIPAAIRALSSPDHADAGKVEGDGWLPIESAPKDGTIVLLGWNDPDIEEIGAVAGWYEGGPADKCWYDQYHEPVTATHWMPLRPLPSAPSQEVAGS